MKKTGKLSTIITVSLLFAFAAPVSAQELPGSYDPRPDMASDIREQYWGTCWVMGGVSSLESYLVKTGLADPDIDLSEEDVLWWTNGNYSDQDPENASSGSGWTNMRRNDGGYAAMTTGYLATVGARAESDIPYLGASEDPDDDLINEFYYSGDNQRPENYYTAPVLYEVTDIVFFGEDAGVEDYKQAIINYGAVTASYYDGGEEYLNKETASYWYPGDGAEFGNHTISVVGWDDNYPKENFTLADGRTPENNGAWLIKNSYGTDYGSEGGYTWISYEDALLFENVEYNQKYSIAGARVPTERKAYYCDEYGAVTSYYPETDGVFTCANVYEFGSGETLDEIMFMTWSKGAQYELYYAPVENNVPAADPAKWTLVADGTVEHAGYSTIEVENKTELPEGMGAIVLTLKGDDLSIGTDEPLLEGSRPMFNPLIQPDSSFFFEDGGFKSAEYEAVGMDGTYYYMQKVNLSLRAYTVKTPEPTDEPAETPAPEPTDEPTETPVPTEPAGTEPTDIPTEKPSGTPTRQPAVSVSPEGNEDKTESDIKETDSAQTGDANDTEILAAALTCAAAGILTASLIFIARKNKI